jgi:hypothetical protein
MSGMLSRYIHLVETAVRKKCDKVASLVPRAVVLAGKAFEVAGRFDGLALRISERVLSLGSNTLAASGECQ